MLDDRIQLYSSPRPGSTVPAHRLFGRLSNPCLVLPEILLCMTSRALDIVDMLIFAARKVSMDAVVEKENTARAYFVVLVTCRHNPLQS